MIVLSQVVFHTVFNLVDHVFGVFPGGSRAATIIRHSYRKPKGRRARRRLRHNGSNQGTRITQTIRTMMENGTPMRTKSPNV